MIAKPSRHPEPTRLLDYQNDSIQRLVAQRGWADLDPYHRILGVYNFVRDEILFGYNEADDVPASQVLVEGRGQCNTKGILLMALLRAVGIGCRFHGFTIDKALQKGALSGLWYVLSPRSILHSWVEVEHEGQWKILEGFILDLAYLKALQAGFASCTGAFCGYGVATLNLQDPPVFWEGRDTFIQKEGINGEFGVYDDPDAFFADHRQDLSPPKAWLFQNLVRHRMNARVDRIRQSRSGKGS